MTDAPSRDTAFSAADLRRAASEGVITPDDADRLLEWAARGRTCTSVA